MLDVQLMSRGYAWLDTGTNDSLLEASNFIKTIESRQGLKVGCIEEIAYCEGFITKKQLLYLISQYPKNEYTKYLYAIIKDNEIH